MFHQGPLHSRLPTGKLRNYVKPPTPTHIHTHLHQKCAIDLRYLAFQKSWNKNKWLWIWITAMHWKWSGNKTIKLAWHLVPHIPPTHQGGLHITDTVDFWSCKEIWQKFFGFLQQVLWCLHWYRLFWAGMIQRECHVFLITAVCVCTPHTPPHTCSPVSYYQLFVPYRWYRNRAVYIDYIHLGKAECLSSSCYTKAFITCYPSSPTTYTGTWCIKQLCFMCSKSFTGLL